MGVNSVVSAGFSAVKGAFRQPEYTTTRDPETGEPILMTKDGIKIEATNVVDNGDGTKTATWEDYGVTAEYGVSGAIQKKVMSNYFAFGADATQEMLTTAYYDDSGQNVIDWGFDAQWFEYYYGDELGALYDTISAQSDGETVTYSVVEDVLAQNNVDATESASLIDGLKEFATSTFDNVKYGVNLSKELFFRNSTGHLGYNYARENSAEVFNVAINNVLPFRSYVQNTGADGVYVKYVDIVGSAVASKGHARYFAFNPAESEIIFFDAGYKGVEDPDLEISLGLGVIYDKNNRLRPQDISGTSDYTKVDVTIGGIGLGSSVAVGKETIMREFFTGVGLNPFTLGGGRGESITQLNAFRIKLSSGVNEWLKYFLGIN